SPLCSKAAAVFALGVFFAQSAEPTGRKRPVSVASACQVRQPKTNSSVVTSLSSASHQAHSYKRKSLSASAISVPSGDIVSHRGGAQSITMRYRGHTNNWPEAAYVDRPGRLGWFQEQGDPRTLQFAALLQTPKHLSRGR